MSKKLNERFYGFIHALFSHPRLSWFKKTFLWKLLCCVYNYNKCLDDVTIFVVMTWILVRHALHKKQTDRKTIIVMVYNTLNDGGAARVATILASEFSAWSRVIVLVRREKIDFSFPVSPNVEVERIFMSLRNYHFNICWLKALKRIENVYATISMIYSANVLNVDSKVNDKVICSERSNPLKEFGEPEVFQRLSSLYERADHVVFQSETVRDFFGDAVKEHSSILPNPIGVACLRKTETRKRIVNVGRLVPQKNQAGLIRAFSRFHERRPEYTLSIYGKGIPQNLDQKDSLEQLIEELRLQDVVKLEGTSSQIHHDIADAEIFVLSSDYEGLSNALLEAMTMGFPCISTDCEGSTDVIENGVNGLLVPRGDEEALTNAMLTLADQEEFREQLGRQAQKTTERFQREKVALQWKEMIERTTN